MWCLKKVRCELFTKVITILQSGILRRCSKHLNKFSSEGTSHDNEKKKKQLYTWPEPGASVSHFSVATKNIQKKATDIKQTPGIVHNRMSVCLCLST